MTSRSNPTLRRLGSTLLLVATAAPLALLPPRQVVLASNPIVAENTRPGSAGWQLSKPATVQIQAYAGETAVDPGRSLTLYVSTQRPGLRYSLAVYRLGWYQGLGGSLKFSIGGLRGQAQGYWDDAASRLVGCARCYYQPSTKLLEARWRPSYRLAVPRNWVTGLYVAKFTDAKGYQTMTPFVVRGNRTSDYSVVLPFTTYQAYNAWGGNSLYSYQSRKNVAATKVSFDRPNIAPDNFLEYIADGIHWMEASGYNLSYASDVDFQTRPKMLLTHKAYISLGHDEYWSLEMRNAVQYARDHGVGLGFFGAGPAYWQIRFEPDGSGVANRTIVCYKVSSANHDLARDPDFGVHNKRLTALWRDPVLDRPENALVGVMASFGHAVGHFYPWTVDPRATSPYLRGTGLVPGRTYGCNLVGYEWDKVFPGGPPDLEVIGTSRAIDVSGARDSSNTTTYVARSGALVFASGSMQLTWALDKYRYENYANCAGAPRVVPGIQRLFATIMGALVTRQPVPAIVLEAPAATVTRCVPVVWTNPVNAQAIGSTLRKTGASEGWNAGASSAQVVTASGGSVQVTADAVTYGRMFGLTYKRIMHSYTDLAYAIELQSDGTLAIYESGHWRSNAGKYAVGDKLKVAVQNGLVRYFRNGALLYISQTTPHFPLRAGAALRDPHAQVANAISCISS